MKEKFIRIKFHCSEDWQYSATIFSFYFLGRRIFWTTTFVYRCFSDYPSSFLVWETTSCHCNLLQKFSTGCSCHVGFCTFATSLTGNARTFGLHALPVWVLAILSVLVILFIINAYNLIDGVDGLAGGLGFHSIRGFLVSCLLYQDKSWLLVILTEWSFNLDSWCSISSRQNFYGRYRFHDDWFYTCSSPPYALWNWQSRFYTWSVLIPVPAPVNGSCNVNHPVVDTLRVFT